MPRETKIVVTPSGSQVEIYTYLTARETNSIKEAMYKSMKIDMSSGSPVVTDLSGQFMLEQESKLMAVLVKSVDGDDIKPLEKLLDGKDEDYQAVLAEVNLIHQGKPQVK